MVNPGSSNAKTNSELRSPRSKSRTERRVKDGGKDGGVKKSKKKRRRQSSSDSSIEEQENVRKLEKSRKKVRKLLKDYKKDLEDSLKKSKSEESGMSRDDDRYRGESKRSKAGRKSGSGESRLSREEEDAHQHQMRIIKTEPLLADLHQDVPQPQVSRQVPPLIPPSVAMHFKPKEGVDDIWLKNLSRKL